MTVQLPLPGLPRYLSNRDPIAATRSPSLRPSRVRSSTPSTRFGWCSTSMPTCTGSRPRRSTSWSGAMSTTCSAICTSTSRRSCGPSATKLQTSADHGAQSGRCACSIAASLTLDRRPPSEAQLRRVRQSGLGIQAANRCEVGARDQVGRISGAGSHQRQARADVHAAWH